MEERGETDGKQGQATPQKEEMRDKGPETSGALATVLVPSDAAVAKLIRQGEQCGPTKQLNAHALP
jgi:hypothetical protein